LVAGTFFIPTTTKELTMADKSPKKNSAKKPGKSIKEKRAEKKLKGAPPGIGAGK
jgi:hypothetical protein